MRQCAYRPLQKQGTKSGAHRAVLAPHIRHITGPTVSCRWLKQGPGPNNPWAAAAQHHAGMKRRHSPRQRPSERATGMYRAAAGGEPQRGCLPGIIHLLSERAGTCAQPHAKMGLWRHQTSLKITHAAMPLPYACLVASPMPHPASPLRLGSQHSTPCAQASEPPAAPACINMVE